MFAFRGFLEHHLVDLLVMCPHLRKEKKKNPTRSTLCEKVFVVVCQNPFLGAGRDIRTLYQFSDANKSWHRSNTFFNPFLLQSSPIIFFSGSSVDQTRIHSVSTFISVFDLVHLIFLLFKWNEWFCSELFPLHPHWTKCL